MLYGLWLPNTCSYFDGLYLTQEADSHLQTRSLKNTCMQHAAAMEMEVHLCASPLAAASCLSSCNTDEGMSLCLHHQAIKGKLFFSFYCNPNKTPKVASVTVKLDIQYIGIFYFHFTCGVKNPKNVLFTHPQYKFTRYLYMLKYSIV